MKFLIVTDGSEFSRTAVEKCCQIIAAPESAAVKIVSVIQEVVPLDAFPESAEYAAEEEREEYKEAKGFLDDAALLFKDCFPNANVDITTAVLTGANDQAVIEDAKQSQADIVVVGSHGRGFWERTIHGSVTDALVHHAPCSVFVVRQPPTDEAEETDTREMI